MQELTPNPALLDVIVATKGDVVTVELDVRNNASVNVGDQYVARWDDGGLTIMRIIGFESAESYSNTIARRTEAMRERVAGIPQDLPSRKAYQVKLAQLRVEGELRPDGRRITGAIRVPNVMIPIERISDEMVEQFSTNPDGNLALGNLRSGSRTLPRVARISHTYAGERMIVLGMPGKGKSQLVRSLLSQAMALNSDSGDVEHNESFGELINGRSQYGILVLDRKGEYIEDTTDQRRNRVFGLHHHRQAPERMVVVSTRTKFESMRSEGRIADYLMPQFNILDIDPIDLADFLPGLTKTQAELVRDYAHAPDFYWNILAETQFGLVDNRQWYQRFPGLFDLKPPGKKLIKKYEEEAQLEGRDELTDAEYSGLAEHLGGTKAQVLERVAAQIKRFCNAPFFGGSAKGKKILGAPTCVDKILDHLAQGRIVFVDMRGRSDEDYTLVAALFARRLLTQNKDRVDEEHIHASLVMEEAHNILSEEELAKGRGGGSVFIELAREGRSFKLGFVLVTQQPDPQSIAAQVVKTIDTIVAFNMPPEDAKHLRRLKGGFADQELSISNAPEFNGVAISSQGGLVQFESGPVDIKFMQACADGTLDKLFEDRGDVADTHEVDSKSVESPQTVEERLALLMRRRRESIAPIALDTMRIWRGEADPE